MSQIPHNPAIDRIDPDHDEPSPSTGWRGVARACHAVPGLGTPDRRVGEVVA